MEHHFGQERKVGYGGKGPRRSWDMVWKLVVRDDGAHLEAQGGSNEYSYLHMLLHARVAACFECACHMGCYE